MKSDLENPEYIDHRPSTVIVNNFPVDDYVLGGSDSELLHTWTWFVYIPCRLRAVIMLSSTCHGAWRAKILIGVQSECKEIDIDAGGQVWLCRGCAVNL